MNATAADSLNLVDRPEPAVALLHPLRRRILEALRSPDSASGLGRRLGLPRQKLNYHLRELEKASLVELVEERRKGNCVERILKSRADYFVIDPSALGGLTAEPEAIVDRFSAAYLVALAARAIRDVSALTQRAGKAGRKVATLSLATEVRFGSAAERNAFAAELATEIARLVARYHREDAPAGRTFRLIVGAHPEVSHPAAEDGGESAPPDDPERRSER